MRDVYVIGLPYAHHAQHSWYGGFARHVGVWLEPPVRERLMPGRLGRWLDDAVTLATRSSTYSTSVLLAEGAAALHMARRRGALYHVLQADRDLWLLGAVSRRRGHRLVATFHKPPSVLEPYLEVHRRLVADIDAVVLVAASQRPHFEQLLPAERIHVVPLGVDTRYFRPPENGERDRSRLCLTVGAHLRDFDTFLEAVRLIHEVAPDVEFLAVGTDSVSRSSHSSSLRPGPGSRVSLAAGLTDGELLRVYRRASLGIFSFRDATASTALLEAMSCGLPIVATAVGGIPEYVSADAGILCPPGDPEALADAALSFLADRERAAAVGAAARKTAARFGYEAVASELRSVYASLA